MSAPDPVHCRIALGTATPLIVYLTGADDFGVREWLIAEGYTEENAIQMQKKKKAWDGVTVKSLSLLAILEG